MLDNVSYEWGKSFTEHLINRTEGFECKVYSCKTKDGCQLQLLRMIYTGTTKHHATKLPSEKKVNYFKEIENDGDLTAQFEEILKESQTLHNKPVVFLQHGLLEAMTVFVLHKDSLAFQLARQGFDVWLGNNRTSWFGQQHLITKYEEVDFWRFSIDEIVKFDLPAMIDFVRQATNQQRICWVGMSQGAGQLFAYLSQPENEQYKNYLSCIVGISPACFLKKNPNSLLLRLLMSIPTWLLGKREFFIGVAFGQLFLPNWLLAKAGEGALKLLKIQSKDLPDDPMKGEWFKNIPLGCTSVNNVVHWFDMLREGGCLRKYNGKDVYPIDTMLAKWRNLYHDEHATEYVPPMFIFLGGKDNVVDSDSSMHYFGCCCSSFLQDEGSKPCQSESCNRCKREVEESCHSGANDCTILYDEEYGHTDFLWGNPDAKHMRHYNKVINFIKKHTMAEQ